MDMDWMRDKSKAKDIFDHVRNYLILGAVFYAALYSFQTADTYRLGKTLGIIVGFLLLGIVLILLAINMIHGAMIFSSQYNAKGSRLRQIGTKMGILLLLIFYVLCAMQIFDSVYKPKMPDTKQKTEKSSPLSPDRIPRTNMKHSESYLANTW